MHALPVQWNSSRPEPIAVVRRSIVIFYESVSSPSGRMYLTKDGSFCSERSEASEHWEIQFPYIVRELGCYAELKAEPIHAPFSIGL